MNGLLRPVGGAVYARPQEPVSTAITIPDGTPVHLYLLDDLSSKRNKQGDAIRFKVREGVRIGDVEVISAGSAVTGHVMALEHRGLAGRSGKLGLSVDYALAANGAKIPLRGEAKLKGGSRGATTLESSVWFGPDTNIHKGTMLNAYVNGDQTVSIAPREIGN